MVQHPFLPQANHPWAPYETERSSFDHRSPGESPSPLFRRPSSSPVTVGIGSCSTITTARTTDHTRMPTVSDIHWTSRSIFPAAVPHHHHRRQSAYMLPTTSAPPTVGNTSRDLPAPSQRAMVVMAAEKESSSSWIPGAAPPPHTRSLYATIPLPPDDSTHGIEVHPPQGEARRSRNSLEWPSSPMSSILPPQANPNPRRFPSTSKHHALLYGLRAIELHPFLDSACMVRSRAHAPSHSPSSWPTDSARVRDAPATTPSVGYLTIVVDSTGQMICVPPTSPWSPHIVTVGDVLAALEAAAVTIDYICRGRCGSTSGHAHVCEGEQLSVILNCLELWWRMPEGPQSGPHPWQLVLGRR